MHFSWGCSTIAIVDGPLVKRLRRCPLTAETGVRFPYGLLKKPADVGFFVVYAEGTSHGAFRECEKLAKRVSQRLNVLLPMGLDFSCYDLPLTGIYVNI